MNGMSYPALLSKRTHSAGYVQ